MPLSAEEAAQAVALVEDWLNMPYVAKVLELQVLHSTAFEAPNRLKNNLRSQ